MIKNVLRFNALSSTKYTVVKTKRAEFNKIYRNFNLSIKLIVS